MFFGLLQAGKLLVGFFVGLAMQSITMALYIDAVGFAVIALLFVPPWPVFNKHPIKWLPRKVVQDTQPQDEQPKKQKTILGFISKILF
eukprot:jgi/Hompol1/4943/HPOL_000463-RA